VKSGFVAIIGRPNAGKSTLLNNLINKKVAITTPKAQTTRNAILGIYNKKDLQIVFVDTPGIHKPTTALGNFMNKAAIAQVEGADIIYYVVDGDKGLQDEDKETLNKLSKYDIPIFLLVNKIDEMDNNKIIKRLSYAEAAFDFAEIIPISALKSSNIDELIETSKKYLKDSVRYYPEDVDNVTSDDFKIAEIIREKIILNTEKEIPHLTAVNIDSIRETDKKVFIEASIIVNKESHKAIIIGKNGMMLKRINDAACYELSKLFDKKIVLSLYVRVEEDWLNKEKKLFELGYFIED